MALFKTNFDMSISYNISELSDSVKAILNSVAFDARVGYQPMTREQADWINSFAVINDGLYTSDFLEEIRMGFNSGISLDGMKDVLSVFDENISPAKWRIAILNTIVANGFPVEKGISILVPDLKNPDDFGLREHQLREVIHENKFFGGRTEKNALGLTVFFIDYALQLDYYKKHMASNKKSYLQFCEEKASEFEMLLATEDGREKIDSILTKCEESPDMTDYYKHVSSMTREKIDVLFRDSMTVDTPEKVALDSAKEERKVLHMKYAGKDSWGRKVFQCLNNNTLYKDIELVPVTNFGDYSPDLHTCGNSFDGEPDCPLHMGKYDFSYDANLQNVYIEAKKHFVQEYMAVFVKGNSYLCTETGSKDDNSLAYKITGENGKEILFDSADKVMEIFDVFERLDPSEAWDMKKLKNNNREPVTVQMMLTIDELRGRYDAPLYEGMIHGTMINVEPVRMDEDGLHGYNVVQAQYDSIENVGHMNADGQIYYLSEYDIVDAFNPALKQEGQILLPVSYSLGEKMPPVKVDLNERELIQDGYTLFEAIGYSENTINSMLHDNMSGQELEALSSALEDLLVDDSLNPQNSALSGNDKRHIGYMQSRISHMLEQRNGGKDEKLPVPDTKTMKKPAPLKDNKAKSQKNGIEH